MPCCASPRPATPHSGWPSHTEPPQRSLPLILAVVPSGLPGGFPPPGHPRSHRRSCHARTPQKSDRGAFRWFRGCSSRVVRASGSGGWQPPG
eukprot:7539627-Alexandrium_andersonii.AAC.1